MRPPTVVEKPALIACGATARQSRRPTRRVRLLLLIHRQTKKRVKRLPRRSRRPNKRRHRAAGVRWCRKQNHLMRRAGMEAGPVRPITLRNLRKRRAKVTINQKKARLRPMRRRPSREKQLPRMRNRLAVRLAGERRLLLRTRLSKREK
jgi:hypothetical protein